MTDNKLPNYFHMYLSNETQFEMLSDTQAGMLVKALFAYANRGAEPDFDDLTLKLFFSLLKNNLDREFDNYSKLCEQNRRNANKRYVTACDRIQEEKEKEEEKEDEEDKEKDTHSEKEADAAFCESVLSQFNGICERLPKVKRLTSRRAERIKQALPLLDGEGFVGLFKRAARSDFLCGGGKNEWKATFDWIMKPDNIARILEGSYDPAESPPTRSSYDIDELEEINRLEGY